MASTFLMACSICSMVTTTAGSKQCTSEAEVCEVEAEPGIRCPDQYSERLLRQDAGGAVNHPRRSARARLGASREGPPATARLTLDLVRTALTP